MLKKPSHPYSPEWPAYWAANPCLHRGVGAEAAEEVSEEQSEESGGEVSEDQPQIADWASSIEDEGLRGTLGKYESQEKVLEAIGYKPPESDWRDGLPDELKKTADRFTSKEDAIRAIESFRKRESQIRVPGKDASEDEIKAFQKAMGVPESPDGYEWPDLGDEITDEEKSSREAWSQRLHALSIPANAAKELAQFLREDTEQAQAAIDAADKEFAQQQEDALKAEWKGESYDVNKDLANRAFGKLAERAGLNLEDLTKIETKDGRFLMDRAEMSKIFAVIGREMAEGTIGPTLTDGERDTLDAQIQEVKEQIEAAQSRNDSKKANQLYQKEQALLAKKNGNSAIVGASGRMY